MTQKETGNPGSRPDSVNYYEILEISKEAPSHEINRAYQRARETYSQDNPALYSMFSAEEARELLRLIEEAFAVLSNVGLRRSYDESLSRGEAAPVIRPMEATAATPAASSAPKTHPEVVSQAAKVKSDHQALPDFVTPPAAKDTTAEGFTVRKGEKTKAELAPGMGRTPISTYKIDSAMEAEIGAAMDFDGPLLHKIRNYKNVTPERMSEATRISRSYLNALEREDYKALPAAVFVRGFVVQVARNLGLDEVKAANSYMKRFKGGSGSKS